MDFLKTLAKGDESNPSSDKPAATNNPAADHKPSNSELFSSAKVVADAAKSQLSNQPDSYDKTKAAGAAANLLDAVGDYGKLDANAGVGKYVEQAEDYLRKYGTATGTTPEAKTTPTPTPTTTPVAEIKDKEPAKVPEAEPLPEETEKKPEAEESEKKPEGAGDYLKVVDGLFDKGESGGEAGDFINKAGGFFK